MDSELFLDVSFNTISAASANWMFVLFFHDAIFMEELPKSIPIIATLL